MNEFDSIGLHIKQFLHGGLRTEGIILFVTEAPRRIGVSVACFFSLDPGFTTTE